VIGLEAPIPLAGILINSNSPLSSDSVIISFPSEENVASLYLTLDLFEKEIFLPRPTGTTNTLPLAVITILDPSLFVLILVMYFNGFSSHFSLSCSRSETNLMPILLGFFEVILYFHKFAPN